ncbi:MAG: serine hydrolase domain-containing protein [Rubrivivax sp.]
MPRHDTHDTCTSSGAAQGGHKESSHEVREDCSGKLGAVVVAATAGWFSLDKETRGLLATLPTNRDLLFWNQAQRDAAFRALDRLPILAKARVVPAGGAVQPLPPGPPLKLALDVDAYMAGQRGAALLVVHDGRLRLERYGLDFDASGRWTSFSVAKSITSMLVGAALRDGHIRSMDDKVSDYIVAMKGSAYDDVSIRQLLTMTSGVQWNEDYADPNSDVARFNNHQPEEGVDALVSYLRRLPRAAPAGTRWNYSTGETNLVGILVAQATGQAAGVPVGEDLGARRHGAAGHVDPLQDRARDQRLLHPGRIARLRPLCPLRPRRREGRWPQHRARWLAGRGDQASAPPPVSPAAATATSGGPTPTAPSRRAASSARACSSTRSAASSSPPTPTGAAAPATPQPATHAKPSTARCSRRSRRSESAAAADDQRATRRSQRGIVPTGNAARRSAQIVPPGGAVPSPMSPCARPRPLLAPPLLPRQQRPLSARSAPPLHATALCATVVLPRESGGPCAK